MDYRTLLVLRARSMNCGPEDITAPVLVDFGDPGDAASVSQLDRVRMIRLLELDLRSDGLSRS